MNVYVNAAMAKVLLASVEDSIKNGRAYSAGAADCNVDLNEARRFLEGLLVQLQPHGKQFVEKVNGQTIYRAFTATKKSTIYQVGDGRIFSTLKSARIFCKEMKPGPK